MGDIDNSPTTSLKVNTNKRWAMTPNSFPHLPGPIRPLTIHQRTVMITSSTSHPSQVYIQNQSIYYFFFCGGFL